jgi:hypothetical protein
MPTVEAIIGNKIAPGLLDHYLARTGYDSQQHDGPEDRHRPDNLWRPVDEERDHGAHGAFDSRASARSLQLWTSMHRSWLIGAGILMLTVALAGFVWREND